jgi:hypothetical protein
VEQKPKCNGSNGGTDSNIEYNKYNTSHLGGVVAMSGLQSQAQDAMNPGGGARRRYS